MQVRAQGAARARGGRLVAKGRRLARRPPAQLDGTRPRPRHEVIIPPPPPFHPPRARRPRWPCRSHACTYILWHPALANGALTAPVRCFAPHPPSSRLKLLAWKGRQAQLLRPSDLGALHVPRRASEESARCPSTHGHGHGPGPDAPPHMDMAWGQRLLHTWRWTRPLPGFPKAPLPRCGRAVPPPPVCLILCGLAWLLLTDASHAAWLGSCSLDAAQVPAGDGILLRIDGRGFGFDDAADAPPMKRGNRGGKLGKLSVGRGGMRRRRSMPSTAAPQLDQPLDAEAAAVGVVGRGTRRLGRAGRGGRGGRGARSGRGGRGRWRSLARATADDTVDDPQ